MATNISSSLIANSSITQQQAKFNFPVSFPLKFTIESANINYQEAGSLTSNIVINGTLKSITPITSGVTSNIGISGSLTNASNFISAISDNTTINATVISDYELIIPVTGTSAIGAISSLNISAISGVISSGSINAADYLTINLSGGTNSNSMITGQSISTILLGSSFISNSTVNSIVTNVQVLSLQAINPTSDIEGIPTVIFTLVTNIIANTSIAISTTNNVNLDSDLSINGNINGNLLNLIESDVIQNSEMSLPQSWGFPLQFPLLITDKQLITYNIASNLSANSVISNNSIQDLLSISLISQSSINATISCLDSGKSDITSDCNIVNPVIINQLQTSGALTNIISIDSTISNQLKEIGSILTNTSIQGTSINTIACDSDVISETEIASDLYKLIECNMIVETNIKQIKGFIFPLTFPLIFIEDINRIVKLESDLISTSEIEGDLFKLVSSDLKANTDIRNNSVFEFPLTFPVGFNGVSNNISLDSDLGSNSQAIVEVQLLISSNVNSSSQTSANISDNVSVKGSLEVEFKINDVISDVTQLSSNVTANSNIAGAITLSNKLVGAASNSSTITGTIKNNVGLMEYFVSNTNINAEVSYLYFIVLKGIFIENSKATLQLNQREYLSSLYINYGETVVLNNDILQVAHMDNIKESSVFDLTKQLIIQPFSINKNVTTVSNIYETVICSTNYSSSSQIITNKESSLFANILIKTKF